MAGTSRERVIRRLLVISYHFPPDGSVGGLRWAGLSKYLARRGWEVHVVTASMQPSLALEPGVTVHYRPRRNTLNDIYNRVATRARSISGGAAVTPGGFAPTSPESTAPLRAEGLVGRLRHHTSLALAFPDHGRGWILAAAAAARELLLHQQFDAVVTSGPPHSAHLAGILACLGRKEPHWVDMRDPLATGAELTWTRDPLSPRGIRALIPHMEQLFFRRGRGVVTNTLELCEVLRARHPGLDVSFIPNGIDRERLPSPAVAKLPGLSIAYAGTLYLGRDLTPVLRAMRGLFAEFPEAAHDVRLRVAGSMDDGHRETFWHEVNEGGLVGAVEFLGSISSAAALDLMNRSHINLVLAQQQLTQVPAKLYECVAMGIPTLVITEHRSAAAREARRIGATTCEAGDIEGIQAFVQNVWRNPAGRIAESADISYEGIAAEMDALLLRAR